MAYGKKKEEEVVEAVASGENEEEVKVVKSAPPKKKTIERDMEVECRSVRTGTLTYINRNGYHVDWDDYGVSEWLTVGELLTMKASQPRFLTQPWIIIEDEDVVDYLGLRKVYNDFLKIEDVEAFLQSGAANISSTIQTLPNGAKEILKDKVKDMILDGTLDSNRTIKLLEQELQADFS
jgi:hypothetical protein